MMPPFHLVLSFLFCLTVDSAFVSTRWQNSAIAHYSNLQSHFTESETRSETGTVAALSLEEQRAQQKQILLGILNPKPSQDPVLADPITKEPLVMIPKSGTYFAGLAGGAARRTSFEMKGASGQGETYAGSPNMYFNLLEPVKQSETQESESSDTAAADAREKRRAWLVRNLNPFIPPPLRSPLATAGILVGDDYVPMRDLFTSPAVSYAYERGWRQNFRGAGFPGVEEETRMAMDYLAPSIARSPETAVLVDMSCATGLFTRRFAKSQKYKRVLGCDYSASMLEEARRRIEADPSLRTGGGGGGGRSGAGARTQLDLVRLDVGQIPMQTDSIDALHAAAAAHCWPDLPAAMSEIYRVLKPGGRFFASTFSSDWFRSVHVAEGGATGPSRQAFQYFESVNQVRGLLEQGGFAPNKVNVEILAPSCMVIRCEK